MPSLSYDLLISFGQQPKQIAHSSDSSFRSSRLKLPVPLWNNAGIETASDGILALHHLHTVGSS
jgi:hypothetical protein